MLLTIYQIVFKLYFLKYGPIPTSFSFIFVPFTSQINYKLKKAQTECLEFEPGAAGWQAQTKPQSYGGHPSKFIYHHLVMVNSKTRFKPILFPSRAILKRLAGFLSLAQVINVGPKFQIRQLLKGIKDNNWIM